MPPDIAANNRRIAKNTLYLYGRMLLSLVVSLFTARIVFNALGVHDYGVLNVVGGFVGLLTYVNGILSMGTSRFITIGLGKGDMTALRRTFSACLTMHLVIAVATLLVGETIGLWFVNNKLVIDAERMPAANVVYQLSLMSMSLGIMQTPYGATVTAHEKMSVYAWVSIYNVVMKLLLVFVVIKMDYDKLILYSVFYFLVGLSTIIFYRCYCIRQFSECSLHFGYDRRLYREIFNYVGWNAIGAFAFTLNGQGVNILLNMFFGPVVNTARGLASRICGYIGGFVSNFQVAVNPQTYKYYAQGNTAQMNRLVMNSSKYSSYLLLIVGLWAFLEIDFILQLWLGQVPLYAAEFMRLTLIQSLISGMDLPIGTGIHAYGRMRLPNLTSAIVYLTILPIVYVVLRMGAEPVAAYIVIVCVYPVAMGFDLWILNKYSGFPVRRFISDVALRVLAVIAVAAIIPTLMHTAMPQGVLRFISVSAVAITTATASVYWVGLSADMRLRVRRKAVSVVRHGAAYLRP